MLILILRVTLLIFIRITSSSVLSGLNATIEAETPAIVKEYKNSSNKCWLQEESTIIKQCHSCSNKPECINTSFVETVECKISGLAYREYVPKYICIYVLIFINRKSLCSWYSNCITQSRYTSDFGKFLFNWITQSVKSER